MIRREAAQNDWQRPSSVVVFAVPTFVGLELDPDRMVARPLAR